MKLVAVFAAIFLVASVNSSPTGSECEVCRVGRSTNETKEIQGPARLVILTYLLTRLVNRVRVRVISVPRNLALGSGHRGTACGLA